MTVDTLAVLDFRTPKGSPVQMGTREGTADRNNAFSCLDEDEYRLRDLDLGDGVAVDIGAHIGGVTVALAVDNPNARVIAVEALSVNVDLLRENLERNGVAARVVLLHAAASKPNVKSAVVEWDFDADESGQHHRYIGNGHGFNHEGAKRETVAGLSLDSLVEEYGEIAFMKIDCELCEYNLLDSPAVKDVREIRGEFHGGYDRIVAMLGDTHHVKQTGGTEAFGAFEAVRK